MSLEPTIDWTEPHTIRNAFAQILFDPADDRILHERPLLAHYTSLECLESILKSQEIWLSHPLYMNDLEELRFGMLQARSVFFEHEAIRNLFPDDQKHYGIFIQYFESQFRAFLDSLENIYVFCFAEHERDDEDGWLSLWRGYGGNGEGAALIIDTSKIQLLEHSPLSLAKVFYLTGNERRIWLEALVEKFANFFGRNRPTLDRYYLAFDALLHRVLMFALSTKHQGFIEEREWRLIYTGPNSDSVADQYQSYRIANGTIEPVMKLPVKAQENFMPDVSLETITFRIILGPSNNQALAERSFQRMLAATASSLVQKTTVSSIPYRDRRR